jgi:hypothetical protein
MGDIRNVSCHPLLAIAKLVFDNIEPLKPWGFLLGDTMPPLILIKPYKKMIKRTKNLMTFIKSLQKFSIV